MRLSSLRLLFYVQTETCPGQSWGWDPFKAIVNLNWDGPTFISHSSTSYAHQQLRLSEAVPIFVIPIMLAHFRDYATWKSEMWHSPYHTCHHSCAYTEHDYFRRSMDTVTSTNDDTRPSAMVMFSVTFHLVLININNIITVVLLITHGHYPNVDGIVKIKSSFIVQCLWLSVWRYLPWLVFLIVVGLRVIVFLSLSSEAFSYHCHFHCHCYQAFAAVYVLVCANNCTDFI